MENSIESPEDGLLQNLPHDDCDDEDSDRVCEACQGDGRDRWNDGITPCEACNGEGLKW